MKDLLIETIILGFFLVWAAQSVDININVYIDGKKTEIVK